MPIIRSLLKTLQTRRLLLMLLPPWPRSWKRKPQLKSLLRRRLIRKRRRRPTPRLKLTRRRRRTD